MSRMADALSTYQAALEQLGGASDKLTPAHVLEALIARDHVAQQVTSGGALVETAQQLAGLDSRLKAAALTIVDHIGPQTFVNWRETLQPDPNAWWWHLDERAAAAQSKASPIWAIAAGLFITVSVSSTAEVSRRFLSVGSDFIGFFSSMIQGLLTVVAGSAFTQAGGRAVERVLNQMGIRGKTQAPWKTGLALVVMLIVLSVRVSMPAFARFYNDQAVRLQQGGRITGAILSLRRAISLRPDYAQAHYNLASAYEEILDWDKALIEYQTALQIDSSMYAAYNNLARVYILRRLDYASALTLINRALEKEVDPAQQPAIHYSLLKNRGWAYLGLRLLGQAEADLRQAITLRPDGAGAHCLLAQVLEMKGEARRALTEWEACLRYEKADSVEASWIGTAKERLTQGL